MKAFFYVFFILLLNKIKLKKISPKYLRYLGSREKLLNYFFKFFCGQNCLFRQIFRDKHTATYIYCTLFIYEGGVPIQTKFEGRCIHLIKYDENLYFLSQQEISKKCSGVSNSNTSYFFSIFNCFILED